MTETSNLLIGKVNPDTKEVDVTVLKSGIAKFGETWKELVSDGSSL